jgi:hypothetical protein
LLFKVDWRQHSVSKLFNGDTTFSYGIGRLVAGIPQDRAESINALLLPEKHRDSFVSLACLV